MIIGSTSTPQIQSTCIPHRRIPTPTTAVVIQKFPLMPSDGRLMFEDYHCSCYS